MLKIGHRGAMGHDPENTLRSFRKALELSVDMVELDVHLCGSGELVVIHDDKVDRTTNGKGYVGEKSLRELKELDAGEGEEIPTLQEVLDLVDKRAKVNVELKGENTAEAVAALINYYIKNSHWSQDDFLVSSFNINELRKFRSLSPGIEIGVLIDEIPARLDKIVEGLKSSFINISLKSVNKKFIEEVHMLGMKVLVFTVNRSRDIERMKRMGVDGIFSNFPDRIK